MKAKTRHYDTPRGVILNKYERPHHDWPSLVRYGSGRLRTAGSLRSKAAAKKPKPLKEYAGVVTRVMDGDTIAVCVTLPGKLGSRQVKKFKTGGLGVTLDPKTLMIQRHIVVRLYGINTPETHGVGACADGFKAASFMAAQLPLGSPVKLVTFNDTDDIYGRYICKVMKVVGDGTLVDLNKLMISEGLAQPFMQNHGNV